MPSHAPERIILGSIDTAVVLGTNGVFALDDTQSADVPLLNESPIVHDVHSIFDLQGFERPRTPLVIGEADLSHVPVGMAVNSLPIKFPGTEYRVPAELNPVRSLLDTCVSYEKELNPYVEDYYAYVSLQCTVVRPGEQQRSATIHSDGIQGRRIQPKVPIEHGYAVVDRYPTQFFPQKFDMAGLDVNRHLMDAVFEGQADRRRAVSFPVGAIVLFDAYCIHQAVPATAEERRTFFRLTYSTRQYDRTGNSVNTSFTNEYAATNWLFQSRPLPDDLEIPGEYKVK